jgi:predicted O-methyltransferase YrrM
MKFISLYYRMLLKFMGFYLKARTRFDVHSPFVAEFIQVVLRDNRWFYAFSFIETLRQRLSHDRTLLRIEDFGAGSRVENAPQRTVRSIAKYSAINSSAGKMLFRMVQHYKPKVILELGTSLGVSTLYLAFAALDSRVITIEGCADICRAAQKNIARHGLGNVRIVHGRFSEALPEILKKTGRLDFLYLDGDHRPGASLQYFEECLRYAHNDSIFVIADIYWSEEMEKAWDVMKNHPRVKLSIDLFHFGALFFREEQKEKEHYALIQARWKPWRIGIF